MSKRILLPIKFSAACDNAFAVGLQLARCCDARFHILHVLDYHLDQLDKPDEQIAQLTRESEKKFAQKYLPLLADFKNFAFNCWEGDGPVETARFAKLIEADFIQLSNSSQLFIILTNRLTRIIQYVIFLFKNIGDAK